VVFLRSLVIAAALCFSFAHAQTGANPQWDAIMEAGHWKRLRQMTEEKLKANPNDAAAHLWMSKIKSSFGDHTGALVEAERAAALDPQNPGAHAQLAEASAFLADRSGPIAALNHVRRMKRSLDAALALNPNNLDALLVQMMFSWKAPSIAGGDKKKAVKVADQIVQNLPVWGNLAHARLLQDSGDDASIERWLLGAVKADPTFYRAHISLARFYCCTAKSKHLEKAEKAANDAIRLDPAAAAGYEALAYVQAANQKWPELEATLAKAAKNVPDDYAPYYFAASALLDIGRDFRRAEQYLNHYLSANPEGRQPTHAQTDHRPPAPARFRSRQNRTQAPQTGLVLPSQHAWKSSVCRPARRRGVCV
jgi:tetratricopeptide (TPR) repeat protein